MTIEKLEISGKYSNLYRAEVNVRNDRGKLFVYFITMSDDELNLPQTLEPLRDKIKILFTNEIKRVTM